MTRIRAAVAGIAVAAMIVGVAAPAGAQEEPEALGFEVDKTEGQPGEVVNGQVNVDDVAEHCTTELEAFQERFDELGPNFNVVEKSELFLRIFPDGEFDVRNHDQTAFIFVGVLAFGLALFDDAAEEALPQTFVMTFADIETQEPVGERGNFDPDTGEGSVVVPDVEPGQWAVAAACVGPLTDLDTLEAGIREGGDFLEEIGAPAGDPLVDRDPEMVEFMQEFLGSEATGLNLVIEFLGVVGPDLLEPIMVPDAFGAVLFCILDEQGNCPADEEPAPPPGEPPAGGPFVGEPAPAQPIVAVPTFTG